MSASHWNGYGIIILQNNKHHGETLKKETSKMVAIFFLTQIQ